MTVAGLSTCFDKVLFIPSLQACDKDGVLEELYIERASQDNYVGNIYKGKVVNLEPSIQAAFVDFGVGRSGFLHISDVEPQYFRQGAADPANPVSDEKGA